LANSKWVKSAVMFIVHTDQFVCIFIFFINMGKIKKSAEIWEKSKKARRYGKICKISKTRRYGKITRRYGKVGKNIINAEIWENNAEIWENNAEIWQNLILHFAEIWENNAEI
jgi:hypothetical protein